MNESLSGSPSRPLLGGHAHFTTCGAYPPPPYPPDHVWSCLNFPNWSWKIHPQPAIVHKKVEKPLLCLILSRFSKFFMKNPASASHFRDKYGKPWLCLILSWFPKFVIENPASPSNFLSQIWEILIVFDLVQKSWLCLILFRFSKFIMKGSSTNHSALSRGM